MSFAPKCSCFAFVSPCLSIAALLFWQINTSFSVYQWKNMVLCAYEIALLMALADNSIFASVHCFKSSKSWLFCLHYSLSIMFVFSASQYIMWYIYRNVLGSREVNITANRRWTAGIGLFLFIQDINVTHLLNPLAFVIVVPHITNDNLMARLSRFWEVSQCFAVKIYNLNLQNEPNFS